MKVGVVFGSRNVEHDVSITSAYWVIKALEKAWNYEIYPIYISQVWKWIYNKDLSDINNFKNIAKFDDYTFEIDMSTRGKFAFSQWKKWLFWKKQRHELDVIFPVLHWLTWEDGTLQWLCELLEVPYASPSVLGSAVWMNKTLMKQVFASYNFPQTKHLVYTKNNLNKEEILETLKTPIFVKPANLGSSIWVSKVSNEKDLEEAIELAFYYDNEIIVEEGVNNLKELNCSVREEAGEIVTTFVEEPVTAWEFLDFEEKYTSTDGGTMQWVKAKVKIPAEIPDVRAEEIRAMTKKIYEVLKINGWAPRIDYLYDSKADKFYVNEINTIPWALQMHLWDKSGVKPAILVTSLIETAIAKAKERELNIDFKSNIIDHTIAFQK